MLRAHPASRYAQDPRKYFSRSALNSVPAVRLS